MYYTYQKSKNPPKITNTIYIFRQFFSFPFSKLPDPNDVVSSINAYGVNS